MSSCRTLTLQTERWIYFVFPGLLVCVKNLIFSVGSSPAHRETLAYHHVLHPRKACKVNTQVYLALVLASVFLTRKHKHTQQRQHLGFYVGPCRRGRNLWSSAAITEGSSCFIIAHHKHRSSFLLNYNFM